jgi:hypothetical protein
MAVAISVPLAADDENLTFPFMDTEISTSDFTVASKKILNRVYNQVLADGTTLASGAAVDTTARIFEKLLELTAAAE